MCHLTYFPLSCTLDKRFYINEVAICECCPRHPEGPSLYDAFLCPFLEEDFACVLEQEGCGCEDCVESWRVCNGLDIDGLRREEM